MQKNKNFIRIATGITALTLTCTLMTGCDYKKRDKFYFYQNLSGNIVLEKDSYISSEYINNYYIVEVYHTGLERSSIYIAYRTQYTDGTSKYTNILNNHFITYDSNDTGYYKVVNAIPLTKYLEENNLSKNEYTYEDIQEIYKMIKENYIFEKKTSLTKKLVIDNRI